MLNPRAGYHQDLLDTPFRLELQTRLDREEIRSAATGAESRGAHPLDSTGSIFAPSDWFEALHCGGLSSAHSKLSKFKPQIGEDGVLRAELRTDEPPVIVLHRMPPHIVHHN